MNWTTTIVAAWAGVLAMSGLQQFIPASYWFEPSSVMIADARSGECPEMRFDRDIHRPFNAAWKVTLLRREDGGFVTAMPVFEGRNDYRPENVLPDDLDLCWWAWSDFTIDPLPPGEYRVNTVWTLDTAGGPRSIRRSSNTFEVTE